MVNQATRPSVSRALLRGITAALRVLAASLSLPFTQIPQTPLLFLLSALWPLDPPPLGSVRGRRGVAGGAGKASVKSRMCGTEGGGQRGAERKGGRMRKME